MHGTFSPEFLKVPKEVLITSMRSHQRYFSIVDDNGRLLPGFITINNTLTDDPSVVVKGNERVLRARLSDARFFFEEDRKVKLDDRVEALRKVVYQQKLGTSYEKMERFRALAQGLAQQLNPAVKDQTARAAWLCKADLVSGMVGEFPEVQGIMGREYALLEGEEPAVANAIAEHYLPIQAGGELPASDIGAFVSIADKLDTVCGCFSVGLIPTGAADPYALRRATIGIISIIMDKDYRLSLCRPDRPGPGPPGRQADAPQGAGRRRRSASFSAAGSSTCWRTITPLTSSRRRYRPISTISSRSGPGSRPWPIQVPSRFRAPAGAFKRVGNIIKEGLDAPVDPSPVPGQRGKRLCTTAFQTVKSSVEAAIAGPLAGGPDRDRHPARPHRHLLRQGHGHGRGCKPVRANRLAHAHGHCPHVRAGCRFFTYRLAIRKDPDRTYGTYRSLMCPIGPMSP